MSSVNITINDRVVAADTKQTVLEAAAAAGVEIPTLCYYKKLSPIGSCRMCLVEVDGVASPMTACELPVRDAMVVRTESENLTRQRRMMVQLILVNHPLDCVICERSGECSLQDSAYKFGITAQPYKTPSPARIKHSDWGYIRYNPNLCIMCERCIHVCASEQGESFLQIAQTGYRSVIGTTTGEALDCAFCGSCISVCPVGALSSNLGLAARSWEMKATKSVCPHCGVGCTYEVDVKKNRAMRITDDETGVNQGSLCLKGRFPFREQTDKRIKTPMIRKDGQLISVTYAEAVAEVVRRWKGLQEQSGTDAIGGIGSGRLPNEDNFMLSELIRGAIGSRHLVENLHFTAGIDLNRIQRAAGRSAYVPLEKIVQADAIMSFSNPVHESPVTGNLIRRAIRGRGANYIMVTSGEPTFKPDPWVRMKAPRSALPSLMHGMVRFLLDAKRITSLADEFRAAADQEGAAWAKSVGLPEKALKAAALRMSAAHRPVILAGRDVYEAPGGSDVMRLLGSFSAVCNADLILLWPDANSRGLNNLGFGVDEKDGDSSSRPMMDAIQTGKLRSLLVMGADPLNEQTKWNGRDGEVEKALRALEFLVVVDSTMTETAAAAHVIFPDLSALEREGTFTAMDGRIQRVNRSIEPPTGIRPAWHVLAELAGEFGRPSMFQSPAEIFAQIASTVPAYSTLEYQALAGEAKFAYPLEVAR